MYTPFKRLSILFLHFQETESFYFLHTHTHTPTAAKVTTATNSASKKGHTSVTTEPESRSLCHLAWMGNVLLGPFSEFPSFLGAHVKNSEQGWRPGWWTCLQGNLHSPECTVVSSGHWQLVLVPGNWLLGFQDVRVCYCVELSAFWELENMRNALPRSWSAGKH